MPTEITTGPVGELRGAHGTAGGDASSTTPAVIQLPPGTRWVQVEGRNYSTAVVVQVALCPYLLVLVTGDLLATATELSENAQDASTSTVVALSSLDTFANGDAVYLGAHIPFRGVQVVVTLTNSNASVLSADYRKSDNTWAALTVTDGTQTGGTTTFGQSGAITWTMPTDWVSARLVDTVTTVGAAVPQRGAQLYWARLKVSAALDASVSASSVVALARSTKYADLVSGRTIEAAVQRGVGGYAAVEHRTDAGTANVIVNVAGPIRGGFL